MPKKAARRAFPCNIVTGEEHDLREVVTHPVVVAGMLDEGALPDSSRANDGEEACGPPITIFVVVRFEI
jgi:hypothetical protein